MIAKRIAKKPDVADNFTALGRYIAAAADKGEKLDKLWIVNCDAGTEIEDLETALAEVEAVRQMKPGLDDKTYHLVVSFRPGEEDKLSAEDLKDIERTFAEALGFGEHQRIAATHQNTDHYHLHMAINKVHPKTLKVHTPFRDFKILEQVCRQMERKYGLARDLGMSDKEQAMPGLSPDARDFEAQTWQQSFQRYMQEHRDEILQGIKDSQDWQAVHRHLADYDVTLRKRGNGLAFVETGGKQAMKASALDRSCSKGALEKRLGPYEPPKRDMAQPTRPEPGTEIRPEPGSAPPPKHQQKVANGPKHRYQARPLTRHPGTSRLWRRYMETRRSTLFRRTLRNWKLFLLSEAYRDPLAMVILIAHQEMFHMVFGDGSDSGRPQRPLPVPTVARPVVEHWRTTTTWARPGNSAWLKNHRLPGHGCRVDEDGTLVIPFRDRDGELMGLRLLGQDGSTLDIGDLRGRALTHVIDPNGRLGKAPAIITSNYALGAAIEAATEAPVVVVPDDDAMGPVLAALRTQHRDLQPIIATSAPARSHTVPLPEPASVQAAEAERMGAFEEDALSAEDALTSMDDLNPVTLTPAEEKSFAAPMVAVPVDATAMEIRTAFAPALQDRALLAWRETSEWATPGNSPWLKAAGIRGYGVRLTDDGRLAVPLKDVRGRLRDVLFIDGDRQERLIGDEDGSPLLHLVDPERRVGKDTLVIATDYVSAAAIHRETRLPVAMAASPERWPEVAKALRARYPDGRLVIALDDEHGPDAEAEAERLRATVVRPSQPEAMPVEKRQAPTIKPEDAERMGAFEEDALSAEDALASLVDLNPVTLTPAQTFGDLAAAGQRDRIRRDLARAVGDRAFLVWDKGRPPAKEDTHPWLGQGRGKQDLRLDDKGNLLVPLRDVGGRLSAVQVVSPDGAVIARHGQDDRPGVFHVVGDRAKFRRGPLVVAADYASATALHHATGRPVACALDDEALQPVAEALRRRYRDREMVIAATDTHMAKENRSLHLAEAAVQSVDGTLLRPPLDDKAKKQGLSSFGDLAAAGSMEAIRRAVHGTSLHPRRSQSQPHARDLGS